MRVSVFFALMVSPLAMFCQKHQVTDTLPISEAAIASFKLEGFPDFMAVDGDDVWVLNTNRVEKISPKSKKPIITAAIPDACGSLVVGYNAVWVASCREQSVYRVDNKTGKILAIVRCGVSDLTGEIGLAVGAGSVWILSDSAGVLTRINSRTNKIDAKINVLPGSYCAAYGYNSIWVTNTSLNSVQRIDPLLNRVVATIPVGPVPRFLAAGENGIWTLNQGDGTVSHIDPASDKSVATIHTEVPGSGGDIAAGAGRIWVRATRGRFLQTINPRTNTIQTIYTPLAGSGAVRAGNHYIWVSAHDINTIWILRK